MLPMIDSTAKVIMGCGESAFHVTTGQSGYAQNNHCDDKSQADAHFT